MCDYQRFCSIGYSLIGETNSIYTNVVSNTTSNNNLLEQSIAQYKIDQKNKELNEEKRYNIQYKKFYEAKNPYNMTECVFTLDKFENQTNIIELSCGHIFTNNDETKKYIFNKKEGKIECICVFRCKLEKPKSQLKPHAKIETKPYCYIPQECEKEEDCDGEYEVSAIQYRDACRTYNCNVCNHILKVSLFRR